MTVEKRYATDDGIGEIHHQIDISFNRDIHSIEPLRTFEVNTVSGIDEEVDLMNVERVHLVRVIRDSPVMKGPDGYGCHRRIRRTVFPSINVEAFLVLGEVHNKVRGGMFYACNESLRQRLENRQGGVNWRYAWLGFGLRNIYQVREHHRGVGVSIRPGIEAKCTQRRVGSGLGSGDDCFHSTRGRNENVRREFDTMGWIVESQRHSIECNDLELFSIYLQICIKVR
jgi:hypothetical protein